MDCLADRLNATCGADVSQSSGPDSLQMLQWSFTRIRTFFYLSNPHEESFEFVDQVPDYNKEVTRSCFSPSHEHVTDSFHSK